MAEDQDQSQKTEEPTHKKLEDAYQKGEAPKSQEVKHWFMMLAIALAVAVGAANSARLLSGHLTGFLGNAHAIPIGADGALDVLQNMVWVIIIALAIPLLFLIAGGLAGNILQGRTVFTTEKIKPKLSKISPLTGLKRMFSPQSVAEFLKSLAKLVIITAIAATLLWPERELLLAMITSPTKDILTLVTSLSLKLIGGVLAAMTVIALLDYMLQRQQFMKKMRMSKQEIKDEHKQLEGDPAVKARIRQLRMERTRQRIAKAVPESDVVITNPTHYAIALEYKHGRMLAPKLRAKGVDYLAKQIRELAEEHKIPIVENPPLARALYAAVEVDQDIPPEHYKAVAEVISYVMKMAKRRLPPRQPRGGH